MHVMKDIHKLALPRAHSGRPPPLFQACIASGHTCGQTHKIRFQVLLPHQFSVSHQVFHAVRNTVSWASVQQQEITECPYTRLVLRHSKQGEERHMTAVDLPHSN